MFCGNCGKELKSGSKFCGFCGTMQTKTPTKTSESKSAAPQKATAPYNTKMRSDSSATHEKYEFSQPKYFLGLLGGGYTYKTIYTTVEIHNYNVNIKQWGKGLFAGEKKDFTISAKDISEIAVKKVIAMGWVVYTSLAVIGALLAVIFAEDYVYALLCAIVAVIGFFNLKRKEVFLSFHGNSLMIPDSDENTESVHNMTLTLQRLNPSIRISNT